MRSMRPLRPLATALLLALSAVLGACRAETTGPVEEQQLHQVATSAAGATTCGLRESGAAYCWGANDFGQLGSGLNGSRLEPTAV
ncbi:MAG TPA: RCC1 domain-containing protein, partial [Gemmatimonadales bacterium]|nr:RCC1 domain-containing protein [Gemmatimonadales bacterium]